ncbi:hypothetical protein ACFE04_007488 [Oxalis oulophora]
MLEDINIRCDARPGWEPTTRTPSPINHQFTFSIDFSSFVTICVDDEDENAFMLREARRWRKKTTRLIECDQLMDSNTNGQVLEPIFDDLDVPIDSTLIVFSFGIMEDEYMDNTDTYEDEKEELKMVATTVKEESISEECSICLESFLLGSEAISLPCSHLFHKNCIMKWVHRKNSCPLCRLGSD